MVAANNAKHAFFYLLVLFTLGFVACGAGGVLFAVIEQAYPLPGEFPGAVQGGMRLGISGVIVAGPVLYLVLRAVNLALERGTLAAQAGVRRWLTYLILLVAAKTAIVDLVVSLNALLGGELTVRFLLKALTILGIAAAVLAYFTYDLTRKSFVRDRIVRSSGFAYLAAVVAVLGLGFTHVAGPTEARQVREDAQRVQHLNSLTMGIAQFHRENKRLPADLDELVKNKAVFAAATVDPISGRPYEYRSRTDREYELCADFALAMPAQQPMAFPGPQWQHERGRTCFVRTVPEVKN
ncbi:MAG: DUF5671 domain-containing protein [Solirubrobacterales bacterium]